MGDEKDGKIATSKKEVKAAREMNAISYGMLFNNFSCVQSGSSKFFLSIASFFNLLQGRCQVNHDKSGSIAA